MNYISITLFISIFVFNFQSVINNPMDCSTAQLAPDIEALCKYCVSFQEVNRKNFFGLLARYPDLKDDPPDCDCRFVICAYIGSSSVANPSLSHCNDKRLVPNSTDAYINILWPIPGKYFNCVLPSELTKEQHPRGTKGSTHPQASKPAISSDPPAANPSPSSTVKTLPKKQPIKHTYKQTHCVGDLQKDYNSKCPDSAKVVIEYKKPEVQLQTDKQKLEIHNQNKRLLVRLLEYGIHGTKVEFDLPLLELKLLQYVTSIYADFCPIVPSDFINNIFQLFHDLHWSTSQGRTEIISETEYKWILKLLIRCSKSAPSFKPIVDEPCKEMLLSADNCTNFICTIPTYEFNLNRTDPIVDSIYKAYELIHSVCFSAFDESYRMYHKFSQVVMDLFTKAIKLRWVNQIADSKFWKRALGPHYQVHLVNMERCNQAAIDRSKFPYRLRRHTIVERARLHGDPGRIQGNGTIPLNTTNV